MRFEDPDLLTSGAQKCGVLVEDLVVGNPTIDPRCYSPYYGEPQKGNPNLGKPPFGVEHMKLQQGTVGLVG